MRSAFNIVSLYAAWFAAVYGAALDRPDLATAASLLVTFINWAWSPWRAAEIALMAEAVVIGLIVDGSLINLGLAHYASPSPLQGVAPVWLLSIWVAFSTSLNSSLFWLQSRLRLASIIAALVGPASYYAGMRLGAVEFREPIFVPLTVLAIFWAIAMPLLLASASRLRAGAAATF